MNMHRDLTRWAYKKGLKQANLTQDELAKITGINRAVLSQFGSGTFILDPIRLSRVAKVLKVSPKELME